MRNNRWGIQLIALVGVVIALIFIFFIVLCLIKVKQTEEKKVDNNNVSVNTVTPLPTPIVKEPIQEESTKITSTDFTLGFLKKENNTKNMLYSPLSIKYALKMLQDGANGNTYTQINNVVGPLSLPKYNNIDNTLSLANGIFIRDTYFQNIKKDYREVLTNQYNA